MRQVYLDYAATSPVKKEVLEAMLPYFTEKFGNPSSVHPMGEEIKPDIIEARKCVAELIGAEADEIYFTAGGTEADNWAVIGTAGSKRAQGNHIITTKIEHHALLHSCRYLENEGYSVTYLDVSDKGMVSLSDLESAITDKTTLISVMYANNETGTIQPIKEIGEIAKKHGVLFHTDAVQAVGNEPIDVVELGVDMLSMSAHKIYGPKGTGALFVRSGVELPSFIHGGAQEKNKRAGTENVPGIIGFGRAAALAKANLEEHMEKMSGLRDYLVKGIMEKINDVDMNGDPERRLPGIVNLAFNGATGSVVRMHMNKRGIAASSGSACSANSTDPSHVLQALGLPPKKISSSIRFSVGDFTTTEELDYVIQQMERIVSGVRIMNPREIC